MRLKETVITTFAGCVLTLGGAVAQADDFDTRMEGILAAYLEVQEALAADTTRGVEDAIHEIESSAKQLHPDHVAGEHAEHYGSIPQDLLAACKKFHGVEDIGSIRQAFRDLSKPVSMWVTMAKPENVSVMYCSMEKAGWVQRGSEVANPYAGAKMKSCGHRVGGGHH